MHRHGRQQERGVREPVDGPDPEPVPRRRRPLLEERDQERRGEPHQLPAGEQRLDRARQRGDHHPQQEQRIQHEEPMEAALAVQVLAGEGADRPREDERQDRHRHREPIEDEFHREVVVRRDGHPVAHGDGDVPRAQRQHATSTATAASSPVTTAAWTQRAASRSSGRRPSIEDTPSIMQSRDGAATTTTPSDGQPVRGRIHRTLSSRRGVTARSRRIPGARASRGTSPLTTRPAAAPPPAGGRAWKAPSRRR